MSHPSQGREFPSLHQGRASASRRHRRCECYFKLSLLRGKTRNQIVYVTCAVFFFKHLCTVSGRGRLAGPARGGGGHGAQSILEPRFRALGRPRPLIYSLNL